MTTALSPCTTAAIFTICHRTRIALRCVLAPFPRGCCHELLKPVSATRVGDAAGWLWKQSFDADAKALAIFLPLAQGGNPTAQFRVARIYTRRKGVPVNETQSCNWWEALANQNAQNAAIAASLIGTANMADLHREGV